MTDAAHDQKVRTQLAWILSISLLILTLIFFRIDYTYLKPAGRFYQHSAVTTEAYGETTTTTLPACKDAKTPLCSGACPDSEWCECRDDGKGCGCVPMGVSCGSVDSSFCAQGQCSKPDEVCSLDKVTGKCGCIPEVKYAKCGGAANPLSCSSGICPPGFTCQTNNAKFECQCAPPPTTDVCSNQISGFCLAGSCPKGEFCGLLSAAGTCGCVKLELTPCGGIKPDNPFSCFLGGCEKEGETCQLDLVTGKCGCTSDSILNLCNQKKYPYCGGGICIQPGFTCKASETNKACMCLPDNPGCNGYSPSSCSEGTCETGKTCALTDGGYCDCVKKPPSSQCGDQDWFYCIDGKCPEGEWCTGINTPDPGCGCVQAPECGSLTAPLCNGGTCPAGTTCKSSTGAYGGLGCDCEPVTPTGSLPSA